LFTKNKTVSYRCFAGVIPGTADDSIYLQAPPPYLRSVSWHSTKHKCFLSNWADGTNRRVFMA